MATPAFARFCRQCAREQGRRFIAPAARHASTSAAAEEGSSSQASTSRIEQQEPLSHRDRSTSNLLNRLRFEIQQARPSARTTWQQLNTINDSRPGAIPLDLIDLTVPILLQHRQPPAKLRGSKRMDAVREQAEELYGRYRFLFNRYKEAGHDMMPTKHLVRFLLAMRDLGYAPAAMRIWEDCKSYADERGAVVPKYIITHTISAALKWMTMYKGEQNPDPVVQEHLAQTSIEGREIAALLLEYVKQKGQLDPVFSSLAVRLAKEENDKKVLAKKVQEYFGIDLDYPAASLNASNEPHSLDKHTLNTLLEVFGAEGDLSKMITLFETYAYPQVAPTVTEPAIRADQNSFFSPNSTTSPAIDATPSPASAALQSQPVTPLKIIPEAVNTATFEKIVGEAARQQRIGVAFHYLRLSFEIWRQESDALRLCYSKLADLDESPIARALDGLAHEAAEGGTTPQSLGLQLPDPSVAFPRAVPAPSVVPSVHSIFNVYRALRPGSLRLARHGHLIQQCSRMLDRLQKDARFWSRIMYKKQLLQRAGLRSAESRNMQIARSEPQPRDGLLDLADQQIAVRPFSTRQHVLHTERAVYEISELRDRIRLDRDDMHVHMKHRSLVRMMQFYRTMGAGAVTITKAKGLLAKVDTLLRHAQRVRDDRLAYIARSTGLSGSQKEVRLERVRGKYQERTATAIEATQLGKELLGKLLDVKTDRPAESTLSIADQSPLHALDGTTASTTSTTNTVSTPTVRPSLTSMLRSPLSRLSSTKAHKASFPLSDCDASLGHDEADVHRQGQGEASAEDDEEYSDRAEQGLRPAV